MLGLLHAPRRACAAVPVTSDGAPECSWPARRARRLRGERWHCCAEQLTAHSGPGAWRAPGQLLHVSYVPARRHQSRRASQPSVLVPLGARVVQLLTGCTACAPCSTAHAPPHPTAGLRRSAAAHPCTTVSSVGTRAATRVRPASSACASGSTTLAGVMRVAAVKFGMHAVKTPVALCVARAERHERKRVATAALGSVRVAHQHPRQPRSPFGPRSSGRSDLHVLDPMPTWPCAVPGPTGGVAPDWCGFWASLTAVYMELGRVIQQLVGGLYRHFGAPPTEHRAPHRAGRQTNGRRRHRCAGLVLRGVRVASPASFQGPRRAREPQTWHVWNLGRRDLLALRAQVWPTRPPRS